MEYKEIELEQGSTTWRNWRARGIGASDASAIIGENYFKNASDLLYEKIHNIEKAPNASMIEGIQLEEKARIAYQEKMNYEVLPLCVESIEFPWLRASLDGISKKRDLIVEIKCGKSAMRKAQQGDIPDYYYGQLQHQLMITGLTKIHYWCYRPEYGGILLHVERDEIYIKELFKAEQEFYEKMNQAILH